jgi:excisionase family DNA binding protein
MFRNYPDIVNVSQLQKMLGIGRNSAYRLVNTGEIKSIRIGRMHKIPKKDVINFLKTKR